MLNEGKKQKPVVSIIIPAHNAMPWLNEALRSVMNQTGISPNSIEVSIYNDLSSDGTGDAISKWTAILKDAGFHVVTSGHSRSSREQNPLGDGGARNRAVEQSCGEYLCFLDADDVMMPRRIFLQLQVAKNNTNAIVGSGFTRHPSKSTEHYTNWANSLTQKQLYLQQFREITIIQPTWFFHRNVYNKVGGYPELKGLNDMEFFHSHLDKKGELIRVEEPLVMYRYTSSSLSWKSTRRDLLRCRLKAFEKRVLSKWTKFSIWGAGRDGHNFFKELSSFNKAKVLQFCDVDLKKIERGFNTRETKKTIPVVHWTKVKPPIVICVSMGRTGGDLESNIRSLSLAEGKDYWHFS
eukprot:CAMPEP_0167765128 /NCGR_PEP_ID=MMETSP0110_2-20121227/14487_1 /TAXON_ID=629695 /ORGANISM="Gymnochlora sp., Strain CCMP2014" /LENGTH=350 /DNA_ID=CAMNT_0007652751 /DNA_START=122 /DNA_END=1174 /DNA_ORIENTATION=+